MRHITCAFALLFLVPYLLHAQYDDLLHKRHISWVAEHTADYELNPVYSELMDVEMNLTKVLRLENQNGSTGLYQDLEIEHYLSAALLQGLQAGAFACFADSLLSRPLSPEQMEQRLFKRDTIVTDAPDWEGSVVVSAVPSEEIDLFRVRQVFFFNARKKAFGARLLAVAPTVNTRDPEGNLTGRQPLLWIKIPTQRTCQGRKIAKSANYVVQTFMRENAPEVAVMQTAKGNLDLNKWATREVKHPAHRFLSYDEFQPLKKAALQALIFKTDTIVVFAPDTFMENAVMVQENAIDGVEKIRFVQNWYYDARRNRLTNRIVAVAPLAAVRDSDGALRYYKPLFYSKY